MQPEICTSLRDSSACGVPVTVSYLYHITCWIVNTSHFCWFPEKNIGFTRDPLYCRPLPASSDPAFTVMSAVYSETGNLRTVTPAAVTGIRALTRRKNHAYFLTLTGQDLPEPPVSVRR